MCVHSMREEAERCRRLAAETADPKATAELEAQARNFDERALEMEAAKRLLGILAPEDAS
jgi:hypothetical protein